MKVVNINDVLKILHKYGEFLFVTDHLRYMEMRNEIANLPNVTPQPKIGHWCDGFGGCRCSECGCLEAGHSDYCPNCGAKMAESEEKA